MPTYHSRDGVTSRLRMRGHDYSSASSYFVTLCTQNRVCLFGDIRRGELVLSHAGVVIDSWWHSIPGRFSSVLLDAVVVMPNHLHAIIHVGADPGTSELPSLSDVMHWFKTRTTYDYILGVRLEGWSQFPGRLWQKNYYEHIIRGERELDRVRSYIDGNPGKWTDDDYYMQKPE